MLPSSLLSASFRWLWPVISLAVLLTIVRGFASFADNATKLTVTEMFVYVVLVVGLYIFMGNTGILSFGHMSFMAIGAYAGAILTIPLAQKSFLLPNLPHFLEHSNLPTVPALLASAGVASLFAAVIGIPLMRLSGMSAALSMFAVLLVVHVVANNWESVTRGRLTMIGVPTNTTQTSALIGAIVAIVCAYVFQESRVGLRLRAAREDEAAAQAIGVNVVADRRIAFVASAFFVGMGGFLYAQFVGAFNPDAFYLTITFITIAMLVVGGINSLAGAVIGTVVVASVGEILRRLEQGTELGPISIPGRSGLHEGGLAALMLFVLIFRSKGITGSREIPWPGTLIVRLRRLGNVVRRRQPLKQHVGLGSEETPKL